MHQQKHKGYLCKSSSHSASNCHSIHSPPILSFLVASSLQYIPHTNFPLHSFISHCLLMYHSPSCHFILRFPFFPLLTLHLFLHFCYLLLYDLCCLCQHRLYCQLHCCGGCGPGNRIGLRLIGGLVVRSLALPIAFIYVATIVFNMFSFLHLLVSLTKNIILIKSDTLWEVDMKLGCKVACWCLVTVGRLQQFK